MQAAYTFSKGHHVALRREPGAALVQRKEPNNNYRPHRLSVSYSWRFRPGTRKGR